jgi:hypothetical protein
MSREGGAAPSLKAFASASIVACAVAGFPGAAPSAQEAAEAPAAQDGAAAFDFEIGRWRTVVKRLRKPLSGSSDWVEYEGTSDVHAFMGGRANLVALSISGPAGRIEGVALRLYRPDTGEWSIHYASAADGLLTPELVGRFEGGRGEFFGEDTPGDRPIRVRFVITQPSPDTARFEQAFSGDGGKTWEVNWIAEDTRLDPADERP